MKFGEKHAELLSQYRGVASVAESMFSDGAPAEPTREKRADLAAGHTSPEAAAAAINKALLSG